MKTRQTISMLMRSAFLGLAVAAVVLVVLHLAETDSDNNVTTSDDVVSFSQAFERAAPAVVNIYTAQEVRQQRFDPRPSTYVRLGSGVIMDPRGFILTAYHVVSEVDEIQVALQDGRVFGAQLIGADPRTDLAVLKIDAENLPVIHIAESYQPRAGDVVLAIGNPYNLGQTVTQGIISATGRLSPGSGYSEFIQMDAAINEGNSGGALVNSKGQLVGINSASYQSQFASRGSAGIYFAISSRLAIRIMQQLITEGVVTRGYLGVSAGSSYSDFLETQGLVVEEVDPESPAQLAGLRPGDFIFEIAGQRITSVQQGLDLVAEARPGTELEIRFYREREQMQTTVTIEALPE